MNDFQQYKVFVVDDDAAVRDAVSMLLGAAGYKVVAFAEPEAFLAACAADCDGCLILDVSMPRMDGPTLQQELLKRSIRLPIIFLSGHGTIQTSVRAIKAGAVDFLTKPVDGAKLLTCVQDALQAWQQFKKRSGETAQTAQRLSNLTDRER